MMLSNECSILLIDDDADVLDAYTQLLEQAVIMSTPAITL
jgi:two-component system phosphoglycerate transport system response regulator PgtA